eukprot:Rmarinus@m.12085
MARRMYMEVLLVVAAVVVATNRHRISEFYSTLMRGSDGTAMPTVLGLEELQGKDGSIEGNSIYIAILGQVFDVTSGSRHYAKGSAYNCFAGRDASASFVTGKFSEEDLTSDVSALSPLDMVGLKGWLDFYHETYTFLGVVDDRFYDSEGEKTKALIDAEEKLAIGERQAAEESQLKEQYPNCNSKWSKDTGGEVWCTKKSGGVERDWVGVPRMMFQPSSNQKRCACVRETEALADSSHKFHPYEDCEIKSVRCKTTPPAPSGRNEAPATPASPSSPSTLNGGTASADMKLRPPSSTNDIP